MNKFVYASMVANHQAFSYGKWYTLAKPDCQLRDTIDMTGQTIASAPEIYHSTCKLHISHSWETCMCDLQRS